MSLTHAILKAHRQDFEKVEIIPFSGGAFEIFFNDELLYSKLETGRFPENFEIESLLVNKL